MVNDVKKYCSKMAAASTCLERSNRESIYVYAVHTLMAKIAHNPLRFGEGFGPELQTHIKRVRKTTNVADARDRRLGREVY